MKSKAEQITKVLDQLKQKLMQYSDDAYINTTFWYGPDRFDIEPPNIKSERLFIEFEIRSYRKDSDGKPIKTVLESRPGGGK